MLFNLDEIQVGKQDKSKGFGQKSHVVSSLEIGMQKSELENAISHIQKNQSLAFATRGAWSAHHLLEYLVRQIGSCECILASWAFSEQAAKTVQALKEQGLITNLTCFLDNRIKEYTKAKSILERTGELIFITSHSKMILLKNEKWTISVVMSANFSKNRTLETGMILTDSKTHEFFKNVLNSSIQE
ncbi:hypothetical protein V9L05_15245 [Bernardetia sp. Wsw4-3y2]|uniref:hypothetical protein n=1 Tax=Bernardetia sp. Wsw4-3y2 TaxID=3127471 RepID=UPI0030CE6606